ncbi:MAG TPA: hypothetical protein VHH11_01580, partial [Gammaproteobacteria bacterium]|nr:hypothetical protein [Gammaproteobacteria bacterium]
MKPNRTVADRPVEPEPVQGTIRYTRPISERLHIDVRDFKRTNMQFEPHRVPVRDARAMEARLSLDVQGF